MPLVSFAQWTNIGPGSEALSSVSFRTSTDGWICGANGALFRTLDGGTTWQPITAFQTTGARNRLISVITPLLYDVSILAQQPSLLLPTDVFHSPRSGAPNSFQSTFPYMVASNDFVYMSGHSSTLSLLVGPGGGIRLSVVQGAAWAQVASGTQNDLWGADSPDGTTYYLVGSKGTIRRGSYPGTVSQAQNSGVYTRLTSVWFVTAQQGYVVGDGGVALRTTNGGVTWLPMAVNTTRNLNAVRFLNATTGFIVGELGTILLTRDGGATWQPETSNTFETLSSLYATPDGLTTWIVGGSGTVLKRGAVTPLAATPSVASPARWQAFPNPFVTELTLVNVPPSSNPYEAKLIDQLGRVVFQASFTASNALATDFPLSLPADLAAGVYSLQLLTPGQPVETRRLVRLPN